MRLAAKKWVKRANVYWMIHSVNPDNAHKYYLNFQHRTKLDRAIVAAAEASKILAQRDAKNKLIDWVEK